MAESLLAGAVFRELLKAVLEMKDKVLMFRRTLSNLMKTLTAIDPLIREIEQHNNNLGLPKEELESLIRDMEEGAKIVYKCSKIRRINICRRLQYQEQLAALIESLERFFKIDMQAQIARDLKETLRGVRTIHSVINKQSLMQPATDAVWTNSAEQVREDVYNHSHKIREEPQPYTSPVIQRHEAFESPQAAARNGSQSIGSQDEERMSYGNPNLGIALYNRTPRRDDELSLTAGEELEIEHEEDKWFYVKKKCPDWDGKMAGWVPARYVSLVIQRHEAFESPQAAVGNISQNIGSQDEESVSYGNPNLGTALYDRTPRRDDELSLTTGEELEIEHEEDNWFYVKKKHPGWDGKMAGWVPTRYVSLVTQRHEAFESPQAAADNGSQNIGSLDEESVSFGNPNLGTALYNRTPRQDDELSLIAGEELEIEHEEDNWFYVKKKCPGWDGKMAGWVPARYVSLVIQRDEAFESPQAAAGNGSQNIDSQDEESVSYGNSNLGTALYNHTPRRDDELSLIAGEELEIEHEEDNWFYAKKKRPGWDGKMVGWVPARYVSLVNQRDEAFESPQAAAGNGSQNIDSQDEESVPYGNSNLGTALYNRTPRRDDELSLIAGEELEIEHEEDNWFYVKKKRPGRDGKMAGWVPARYVQVEFNSWRGA